MVMMLADVIGHENQSQNCPDHRCLCLVLTGRISTPDDGPRVVHPLLRENVSWWNNPHNALLARFKGKRNYCSPSTLYWALPCHFSAPRHLRSTHSLAAFLGLATILRLRVWSNHFPEQKSHSSFLSWCRLDPHPSALTETELQSL